MDNTNNTIDDGTPSNFVGKTLREVKSMHSNVRVVRAGGVGFVGTADYNMGRLNVSLGAENLKFSTVTKTIGGHEYVFDHVDESTLDNGVVISCYFG